MYEQRFETEIVQCYMLKQTGELEIYLVFFSVNQVYYQIEYLDKSYRIM